MTTHTPPMAADAPVTIWISLLTQSPRNNLDIPNHSTVSIPQQPSCRSKPPSSSIFFTKSGSPFPSLGLKGRGISEWQDVELPRYRLRQCRSHPHHDRESGSHAGTPEPETQRVVDSPCRDAGHAVFPGVNRYGPAFFYYETGVSEGNRDGLP
jgi:hypothetical protein